MTNELKISDITVYKDGAPTPAGTDLMRRIHEAAGMGCWHELVKANELDAKYCKKCKDLFFMRAVENPAYLSSLDAWRPLWEKMEKVLNGDEKFKYGEFLSEGVQKQKGTLVGVFEFITAAPHHHLEAAAITLNVLDEWRADNAK